MDNFGDKGVIATLLEKTTDGKVFERINKTKNDHYVSQFYLKSFSDEKNFIYSHKFTKKIPIKSICFRNTDKKIKEWLLEIERNNVESGVSKIINIINSLNKKAFKKDDRKLEFSLNLDIELLMRFIAVINIGAECNIYENEYLVQVTNCNILLNDLLMSNFLKMLFMLKYSLIIKITKNITKNGFITSNLPVLVIGKKKKLSYKEYCDNNMSIETQNKEQEELVNKKIDYEIHFPLTPKILLSFYGNESHKKENGLILLEKPIATTKFINNINERFLHSMKDNDKIDCYYNK